MANTFKNAVAEAVGITEETIYTVPASTTTTLIGLSISNITTGNITVDVTLTDTSAGDTVHLIKDGPITPGSALVVIGGDQKVVMETTDVLKVTSSDAASADVLLSMLEIT